MLNVKDANGQWVVIEEADWIHAMLSNNFTLFGMDVNSIREFQLVYMEIAGKMPINPENIRSVLCR